MPKNRVNKTICSEVIGTYEQMQGKGRGRIPPAAVHFRQVAFREHQLLLIRPREKLWSFWQSMVTAIIRRRRGPPRIKVVPPVRIPSGLGEVNRTFGAARPTTARLRPLTARNRPQTGRTRQLGETQSQESLSGPKKSFHFFKVRRL